MLLGEQYVAVHAGGVLTHQFGPPEQQSVRWTRDLREVSRCELTLAPDGLPDIVPWVHWVSVFDTSGMLWRGPVLSVTGSRSALTISARDPAAYLARTRCPLTKRWEAADPAVPATALWEAMAALHGFTADPVTRYDTDCQHYDFATRADTEPLDKTLSDLTGLGLRWCVVAGTPIIGAAPKTPVTALSENDFLSDIALTRDGTGTFNDILLRTPADRALAAVRLYGLHLQALVSIDDTGAVSNTVGAARQLVDHTAAIRTTIDMPSGAALHPDAAVTLEQLVPSARFVLEVGGVRVLTELDTVEAEASADSTSVKISLTEVPEKVELLDLRDAAGQLVAQVPGVLT